jgi:hypothetical protein
MNREKEKYSSKGLMFFYILVINPQKSTNFFKYHRTTKREFMRNEKRVETN